MRFENGRDDLFPGVPVILASIMDGLLHQPYTTPAEASLYESEGKMMLDWMRAVSYVQCNMGTGTGIQLFFKQVRLPPLLSKNYVV